MSSPKLLLILAVAAGAIFIVVANRSSTPFGANSIATFVVVGLALGGIYAISACGLVVTHSTTGVFNFAHGAVGAFLAFLYWELRVHHGWPAPLALVVVLGVVAPAIGVFLDVALMRRLRNAPLVTQLMVTVGLMLTFMGVTSAIWPPTTGRTMPAFFQSSHGIEIAGVVATWHRVIAVVLALGLAVGLRALLRHTRLGISMRAIVDNRSLAALNGVRANRVSGASWALGCMTAGLAGILIAPETGMVVENLSLIIIVAFAAAAVAQMRSLVWAFVGAVVIGLAQGFSGVYLTFGTTWAGFPDAIPAIVLLIALLLLPSEPLRTSDRRVAARREHLSTPLEALGAAAAMFALVAAWANGWIPWFGATFGQRSSVWLGRGAGFLVIGLIMLSLVPLIGWAGQVSFANFAIAGFGAALFSHVGGQDGHPYALVVVALLCAALGALIAVPALRLKGLYLALATMAFAELADKVLFRYPGLIDSTVTGPLYRPLDLFGMHVSTSIADRKNFVLFVAAAFSILFVVVALLRRSRWARRWVAIADSPAASATVGVRLPVAKIAVFALSGALAGFAGCLYGLSQGTLSPNGFPLFAGLPLVLLLAVQGMKYPIAPFLAAIGLAAFPAIQEVLGNPSYLGSFEILGPGLLALTMARFPEGIIVTWREAAAIFPWRHDARADVAVLAAQRRARDVLFDIGPLGASGASRAWLVPRLDALLGLGDAVTASDGDEGETAPAVPEGVGRDAVPVG